MFPNLTGIKSVFTRKKYVPGNSYAVESGTFCGETLVLIELKEDKLFFLCLPALTIKEITKADFDRGLENKIVKFIENLPKFAFKTCKKQYQLIQNKQK
jgi:hypothetical protein